MKKQDNINHILKACHTIEKHIKYLKQPDVSNKSNHSHEQCYKTYSIQTPINANVT